MRKNSTSFIRKDYGGEKLAGKTVRFRVTVKGLRRREVPEANDEFAQDLGDFRTLDELRDALRKSIFSQRDSEARRNAKDKLVEKLVDANEFPVPQVFVDRQIETRVEQRLRSLSQQGVEPEVVQSRLGQDSRGSARRGPPRGESFAHSESNT